MKFETQADSVGIIFDDNSILSPGPKSEIVIDQYVFVPEKGLYATITRMVNRTCKNFLSWNDKTFDSRFFHEPDFDLQTWLNSETQLLRIF